MTPTRIQAAQQAADAFLEEVPDRFQVGLVTFAGAPSVEALPTSDKDVVQVRPPQRGHPPGHGRPGTRWSAPSRPAARPLVNNERPPTAILLLTDGESRSGVPPVTAAQQAREEGVPVFTVAIAPQPSPELQEVAEVSGGQAFAAPPAAGAGAVYRDLGARLTYVEEKRRQPPTSGRGGLFLLLGAAASITGSCRLQRRR